MLRWNIALKMNQPQKFYILGFIIATISEVLTFVIFRDLYTSFNLPLIIFVISSRFLSGLGIFSTLSMILTYLLKYSSPYLKKKKELSRFFINTLNLLTIGFFCLLVIYNIYSLLYGTYELYSLILGILMVVFSYYLTPIWKPDYSIRLDESWLDNLKSFIKGIKLDVIRGYYKYLSKDYLRAYSIDYIKFRVHWDRYRYRTSIYIVPLFAVSILIVPFFFVLLSIICIKLLIFRKNPDLVDYIIISLASLTLIYISLISDLSSLFYFNILWFIPYLLGIFVSFIAYLDSMFLNGRLFK